MVRGDIVIVSLPVPARRAGSEQTGYRPAVVIQSDATSTHLPTTLIVPFTSKLRALRFPHTFRVNPSPQNGLEADSVLLVFQLRAIDKSRLERTVGQLEEHHLRHLETEIDSLVAP